MKPIIVLIELTPDGLFINHEGRRIAKRGPKAWIALDPGYTVTDAPGGLLIERESTGPKIRSCL
jgi:hypothetical protein